MTGPGSSPSAGPDLAALREKAEKAHEAETRYEEACQTTGWDYDLQIAAQRADEAYWAFSRPGQILAVLSLVDDLRAENDRLREVVEKAADVKPWSCAWCREVGDAAQRALAGSPADTKEATDG